MKKIISSAILVLALVWSSCSPEELKDFTAVDNGNVEAIYGTWNGTSVNQRDIGAEAKGFPYKNEDMTAALDFTKIKLTLNGTGSTPGSFSINYGTAPQFFKFNSGNWSVDNPSKVGKIYLINGAGNDTITMVMGSYQELLNNKLKLVQTKTLLGQPAIVYEYQFSK
jgi:hypothetical protein